MPSVQIRDVIQSRDNIQSRDGNGAGRRNSIQTRDNLQSRDGNGAVHNGHNGNGNGHSALKEYTLNIAIVQLISGNMEKIGRQIIFDGVTDRPELERRLVQAD